ncbi:MAG: di-heme oxidoredictase family protein [Phototrophicaceae bacterium]
MRKLLLPRISALLLSLAVLCTVFGIAQSVVGQSDMPSPALGGLATAFSSAEDAFEIPIPGLTAEQLEDFEAGDELFGQDWLPTAVGDAPNDGLGPIFNATSCETCHLSDGRGRPPQFEGEVETGLLVRLSLPQQSITGENHAEQTYGGQFQDVALEGVVPEGSLQVTYTELPGAFPDGTPYSLRQPTLTLDGLSYGQLSPDVMLSPRIANQMIGLGLLEAVPDLTLMQLSDPSDSNNDQISGRVNIVWDAYNNHEAIGRFGWKANQPHLFQQNAAAFNGDIGIVSSLFPQHHCTDAQPTCLQASLHNNQPEISDEDLMKVLLYTRALSVPAQRNSDDPQVQQGYGMFVAARCNACHVETLTTGEHPELPALANQTIHPYTDLLLHNMGEGLADNAQDFRATGEEWRTPPLWGIGLFQTVNGYNYYLHDGRARNLTEAILWHGGEATTSREAFIQMSAENRAALLAFLASL